MAIYKIFITNLLFVVLLYGCDKPAGTKHIGQKQTASAELPAIAQSDYGNISSSIANGQTIQFYSTPSPLAKTSLNELKSRAKNNEAQAIAELGRRYSSGIGVSRDIIKAKELYITAAKAGDPMAQNELAGAYDYGLFGEEDPQQAVYWYKKAAEQDFAPAEFNLGKMYQEGSGVKKDYSEALYWFRKAADNSFPPAQTLIGIFFEEGHAVESDSVKAAYWYKKAASNNYQKAQYNLGVLYEQGNGIEKDINKAIKYYTDASKNNHEFAQVNLGLIYLFGDSGYTDYKKSYYLFNKSAKNGTYKFPGIFNIAQMYENGLYVDKSFPHAYAFYFVSLELIQATPCSSWTLSQADILDSINTLKAQMSPEQIQAGEQEIAHVMREYGVTL